MSIKASNVIKFNRQKSPAELLSKQELIDDIGAKAFLFIRDEADALGLSIKDVITEHMLGLTMVIESVEGSLEAQNILKRLEAKLSL